MKRIAIAGNPNSGKTTVFNTLSGRNERIGNWAGVTVEKKEARLRRRYNASSEEVFIVDLPGAYAMEAYTNDELEATNFIKNEHIDAIINIVDASNLERSLFLTMQLIDTGVPVVIALNKADITKRRKTKINIEELEKMVGVNIYFTQATCSRTLIEVVNNALEIAGATIMKNKRGYWHGQSKQKKGYKGYCFKGGKKRN